MRARFANETKASFYRTNGTSLPMVLSGNTTFVYSFDAMVHFPEEAVSGYVEECARILKPGGTAFLHHVRSTCYCTTYYVIVVHAEEWSAMRCTHTPFCGCMCLRMLVSILRSFRRGKGTFQPHVHSCASFSCAATGTSQHRVRRAPVPPRPL